MKTNKPKKRNFFKEYSSIQSAVVKGLKKELKRLKRSFKDEDDDILDFFSFASSDKIEEILPDGTAMIYGLEDLIDLGSLIDNGDIPLLNAISLLEELTDLKK